MDHKQAADEYDERAKTQHIDPPRPGRKSYTDRYEETSEMSSSDIRSIIIKREAAGKECGVLHRVLADRGE